MKAVQEGVLEAHVTSAFPLDKQQMDSLIARLEAKLGRKVSASQSTDSALIGGVVMPTVGLVVSGGGTWLAAAVTAAKASTRP